MPAFIPDSASTHRPRYTLDRDPVILHRGSFDVPLQTPVQNSVNNSASASVSTSTSTPVSASTSATATATTSVSTSTSASISGSVQVAVADADVDADDSALGSVVIKRRAPIACRRCRRMRSKCLHDKAVPPCRACLDAGLGPSECVFPVRGQPDNDREFRHPRMRADKASRRDPAKVRRQILDTPVVRPARTVQPRSNAAATDWDSLPPLSDIIEGVNRFTQHYFQLGFIPKEQFPRRLRTDHQSMNIFLVLSILSISARLTPSIAKRYGSGLKAADYFIDRASQLAYGEIYQEPTLERCQAFYLLSIAQQGSGIRNNSYINMGISMRMAALMRLHREETYQIQNPNTETIIRAESARRTLWMLHSQDQLHSGPCSPVSLAATDITALLPCDEVDFAVGRQPASRAALEGTPPAIENPALITVPGRSLFASLIQSHHFWGTVSRRAVNFARSANPWDPNSEFARIIEKLRLWEDGLPPEHRWEVPVFKHHKAHCEDLAYLGVTMIPRLCNIVCRRPYLIDFIVAGHNDEQKRIFFSKLSLELFYNVRRLFQQIDAQFTGRTPDESVGAQMAAFCVYCCGLFSTYLCRYPNICPDPVISSDGPMMLHRTLTILRECKEVWPLAARWVDSLERFTQDPSGSLATEDGMADGKDPIPNPVIVPILTHGTGAAMAAAVSSATPSTHSSSPSSMYTRPSGSVDASQSTGAHKSPSSTELTASPLTATPNQSISYFSQQQQLPSHQSHTEQSHPHRSQLLHSQQLEHQHQHQHQFHHTHHHHEQQQAALQRQQPQHPGPHTPVALPIPDNIPYHSQVSTQMYINAEPPNPNTLGMFMDSQDNPTIFAAAAAAAQGYSLPNEGSAIASEADTHMFYTSSDGFDAELEFYVNGTQDWMPPSGVFDGYC
ncbi:hypothetical protein BGZ63DRAFT_344761 [Mariannaea sp. PMI_226]|nr:hypothetical protein BGZ63DRAFT_344761 [Mariannaea sp. PMI_226]